MTATALALSCFALYEAALTRRLLTDPEWTELVKTRPDLQDALAAHQSQMSATAATPAEPQMQEFAH